MRFMRFRLGLLVFSLVVNWACGRRESTAPGGCFDVVILGGRMVDGTGAAWFYGGVGIRGDRVVRGPGYRTAK